MDGLAEGRGIAHGLAAAVLVAAIALAFPSLAAAAPACPAAATFPSVHSGNADSAALQCDDPSGTGLNYSIDPDHGPAHGQVLVDEAGGVRYASDSTYKGADGWTVRVDDNEGGTSTVVYTVQVTNQAPVCQDVTLPSVTRGQQS